MRIFLKAILILTHRSLLLIFNHRQYIDTYTSSRVIRRSREITIGFCRIEVGAGALFL